MPLVRAPRRGPMKQRDWMALNKSEFEKAFFEHAGYYEDAPRQPYSIRIGSKAFFSHDTMDLRKQVEKHITLLRARATRERNARRRRVQ